jgi:hypothetical protein
LSPRAAHSTACRLNSRLSSRASPIRSLYLWPSLWDRTLFQVSTGDFHLMAVTLVHPEEEALADTTTPPHLLLLLRRCGYVQPCDPHRPSVKRHPRHAAEWDRVQRLSHDEAFAALMRPFDPSNGG